ncbi:MAG TPA: NAD(P)-dependent oxidoreductase [Polyangiaceae bacterium]|jgi:siroheme synthase-like protein
MSGFPIFLKLEDKLVLVVGDGPVAREKMARVLEAGARVRQVAPELNHAFRDEDLDGVWLAIAAATADVNRAVRAAADARRVFVIAVDDVASCSAFGAARIDRGGLTVAISSDGRAPALVALLRRAIESLLPDEIETWREIAERERAAHRAAGVPMESRRPLLLRALDALYPREAA